MPGPQPARRPLRWVRHGVLLVVAAGALTAACSTSSPSSANTTRTPAGVNAQITIKDFQFTNATVKAGSTVTVVNDDAAAHNIYATAFQTTNVNQGKTVTFKAPTKPGVYSYICSIHTYMHGDITVTK
jgi:plastocyanin